MTPYLGILVPLIMDTMQDQSSASKREVALKTLGKLGSYIGKKTYLFLYVISCRNDLSSPLSFFSLSIYLGYVIRPFFEYPQLLDLLINAIKSESNKNLRQEVIKTLGVLGGLDPYKYKMIQLRLKGQGIVGATGKQEKESEEKASVVAVSSNEMYYPTVTITALVS